MMNSSNIGPNIWPIYDSTRRNEAPMRLDIEEIAPGVTKKIVYTYETYMSAEKAGSPPVPSGPGDLHA